jgi:hypothetical protein
MRENHFQRVKPFVRWRGTKHDSLMETERGKAIAVLMVLGGVSFLDAALLSDDMLAEAADEIVEYTAHIREQRWYRRAWRWFAWRLWQRRKSRARAAPALPDAT